MSNLAAIEKQAGAYAVAREQLSTIVTGMNEQWETIKRSHMKALKRAVEDAAKQHERLKALIEDSPGCFKKPRTLLLHGIKLGFQKGKGKIEWSDGDQVVKLIKKYYPEQADVLITTTEKPVKDALAQLSAAELKKLGINVTDGGDAVFIKPADSAIDKMVDALLKDATSEVE